MRTPMDDLISNLQSEQKELQGKLNSLEQEQGVLRQSRGRPEVGDPPACSEYRDYQIVMATSSNLVKIKKAYAWQDAELKSRMGSL